MTATAQERLTLTVDEAAAALGIGRTSAYLAIRTGTFPLPVIHVGRRILVPRAALDRLLAGETANAPGEGRATSAAR